MIVNLSLYLQVFFRDQPSSNSTPNGKDVLRQNRDSAIAKHPQHHPSDTRRVTFRDSLGDTGCSKKTSPVFLEESRHKLLYGAAGTHAPSGTYAPTGTHAPTNTHILTGTHPPTPLYSAPHIQVDEDSSSEQGSSIDSGRGPSEEDQDPNRSGQHDNSHDNIGAVVATGKYHTNIGNRSEYMCMDQAAQRVGDNMRNMPSSRRSNSDRNRYSPSGEQLPTLPPRKLKNSRCNRLQPPSYHSSNHSGRLASSSAPEMTLDKHQGRNLDFIPGIHGTNPHTQNQPIKTHAIPASSYSDINGKNIGRYNCKNPGQSDYSGRHLSPNHWSGFDSPSGSHSGPDSVSDGGSSTSGSYMVDLGAEVSGDVFV